MAITTDNRQVKEAQSHLSILKPLLGVPTHLLNSYLTLAAALGVAGGASAGAVASYVKTKNPKLTALERKKKFYDSKVEELANENWLNEVMTLKKKLETSRLSDEERSELEKQYVKLINAGK